MPFRTLHAVPSLAFPLLAAAFLVCLGDAASALDLAAYERYLNTPKTTAGDAFSAAAPGAARTVRRQSDEAFLEELLAEEETADPEGTGARAGTPAIPERLGRRETVRWHGEFHASDRRPGYLLLSDESDEPDYATTGYASGIRAELGGRVAVAVNHATNSATESGSGEVTVGRTGLSVTLASPGYGSLVARAASVEPGLAAARSQYGLGYSGASGPWRFGLDLDRKIHAADAASAARPAEYDRVAGTASLVKDDLYLSLRPAFERYAADANAGRELAWLLAYAPSAAPGWSFDLHGDAGAFSKTADGSGARFVYFSPKRRGNIGVGAERSIERAGTLALTLGAALDRETYAFDDEETSYLVASGRTGIEWRPRDDLEVTAEYAGSLSRTDGFPVSQTLRGGFSMNF